MRRINAILLVLIILVGASIAYKVYAAETKGQLINARRPNELEFHRMVYTLRPAAILTTSYVATSDADIGGRDTNLEVSFADVGLVFDLTAGSLTSFEYIIWFGVYVDTDSDGDADTWVWARECTETVAATQITDTIHNYKISLTGDIVYFKPLPHYGERVRVQVKGTGTVTGSSCAVYLVGIY